MLLFADSNFSVQFNYLIKMLSTRKKKHQHETQLSQRNKTSNDFVVGNDTHASAIGNETLAPRTNSLPKSFERVTFDDNSICQDQFIENNIDDRITEVVDNVVKTVENRMHDAILTAMDNVIIPLNEMAVKLIKESSRQGPSSVVQNPDRRDF